jgi:hypothetical protein
VHDRWLPAINGHRDVGQTACPGKYLYAKIPLIREYAAADQRPFTARALDTDLAGSRWPDLVVREKGSNKSFVVRTGGQVGFADATTAATGWSGTDLLAATQDITGDGVPDMLARSATTKETGVYPGDGAGHFGAAVRTITKFRYLDQLVAAGDLDGNGTNDVVGRRADTQALKLYPGTGAGGFGKGRLLAADWSGYSATLGTGDLNGDGRADLVVRKGDSLLLVPGTGRVALGTPTALPRTWGGYDLVAGMGDVTNDGLPDLVARVARTRLTYVYPGDGKGGLGTRFGPFDQFQDVDFLAGAGPVAGTTYNDLVGRAANGRMVLFANRGGTSIDGVGATGAGFGDTNLVLNVGDWNGDGYGDVLTRQTSTGSMLLRAGDGNGGLAAPVVASKGWSSVALVAAVGDVTGDGYPDLMGQPSGGSMRIYPGNGGTGFKASYVAHSAISSSDQLGAGLWNGDGAPDSLLRKSDGTLVVYAGNGPGGLTGSAETVGSGTGKYDWMIGAGDVDGDGRSDVLARQRTNGRLWLLPGTSTGFGQRRFVADGFGKYDLAG